MTTVTMPTAGDIGEKRRVVEQPEPIEQPYTIPQTVPAEPEKVPA